jgi:hypothetical protein
MDTMRLGRTEAEAASPSPPSLAFCRQCCWLSTRAEQGKGSFEEEEAAGLG